MFAISINRSGFMRSFIATQFMGNVALGLIGRCNDILCNYERIVTVPCILAHSWFDSIFFTSHLSSTEGCSVLLVPNMPWGEQERDRKLHLM
mgnify:CR=1 FL=1